MGPAGTIQCAECLTQAYTQKACQKPVESNESRRRDPINVQDIILKVQSY